MLDLVAALRQEFDTSVLFISHNLAVIAKMCDRVGVLYAGELVEQGPARQVFDRPGNRSQPVDGEPGADEYPYVATTYRLTEHFHYWTKNNAYNVQLQPEFFVEMSEELAREKNVKSGDQVKVTSARGAIQGKAMVTKRIKPMQVAGKTVHQIGFPIHWGFSGDAKHAGPLANLLTSWAIDPNTWTPEFKSFLVNLEKA